MLRYRLYLLGDGVICAWLEFLADNDAEALQSAALLFDACSDVCSSCELWNGSRMLAQEQAVRSLTALDELSRARQKHIIDMEETLHSSRWRVEKSARLAEVMDTAHKARL